MPSFPRRCLLGLLLLQPHCRNNSYNEYEAPPRSTASSGASAAPVEDAAVAAPAPIEEVDAGTRPPGPLTRQEAVRIVQQGLGRHLSRMQVTPMFRGGQFAGFRLDRGEDLAAWRATGVDLRVGDLITRVNGIRIERPEHAQWAFERLRIVEAIEIEVLRNGTSTTIRSPILGEPIVPPPRTP